MKTKVTKSKFQAQLELGHKEIKGKRARMFQEDAKEHSAEFIRSLKSTMRKKERQLMDLEDFHVSSTTSLQVTKDGFNSKLWVKEMNSITVQLRLDKVELDIAQEIHKDWFNETVE